MDTVILLPTGIIAYAYFHFKMHFSKKIGGKQDQSTNLFKDYSRIMDPDTITKPGMYHIWAGNEHSPDNINGYLYIHFHSLNRIGQIAFVNGTTDDYFIRTKSSEGGTYSPWRKIITNFNFDAGSVTVNSIPANGTKDVTIQLHRTMTASPHVVLTSRERHPEYFAFSFSQITPTSFLLTVKSNSSAVVNCAIEWIAVCG